MHVCARVQVHLAEKLFNKEFSEKKAEKPVLLQHLIMTHTLYGMFTKLQ